jgi:hypothetical protein
MNDMEIRTPEEAAEWMLREWRRLADLRGEQNVSLWRGDVLRHFEQHGYPGLVYANENGNQAIDRKALHRFKKLTPNLVYDRYFESWRMRFDPEWQEGRGQW